MVRLKKHLTRLVLLAIVAMLPQLASAYSFMVDGIAYDKNSDGNSVTVTYQNSAYNYGYFDSPAYSNLGGPLYIPSIVTYGGKTYSVTSIGRNAFDRCSGLTSVIIPNSVTSIGEWAFSQCSGLTSVTIGNSVTSIGRLAFWYCIGLTSVTIGNSVTSIGNEAFSHCEGLTTIEIPNSVTSIGGSAFSGCSGLTSVTIPNSVTSIGSNAFVGTAWFDNQPDGLVYAGMVAYKYKGTMPNGTSINFMSGCAGIAGGCFSYCSGLTSVTIPSSVMTIGGSAFSGCSGLTSIIVDDGNPQYDSRDNCNAIIETATNILITGCMNTIIPNSVTSIGSSAFYGCSGLTSVTIPNSVTSIGRVAFEYCSGLTSVTIGNSVTSIDIGAFDGCFGLTSIEIPNSVTTIGDGAFKGCSGLTSVTIPNSVTSIGSNAFYYCSGLTSVTIPNSVTSIGNSAFSNCSGLTSMVVESGNTQYDSRNNCNAIIETATNTLISGCMNTIIPNSVTTIGWEAFSGCTGLTSVTIPNSVASIGDWAFHYCTGLTSVTIPNSVTSIGDQAFSSCYGLTTVTIGESVESIGSGAFSDCSSLLCIFCDIYFPQYTNMGDGVFSGIDKSYCYLIVPDVSYYESANQWNLFNNIVQRYYDIIKIDGLCYRFDYPNSVKVVDEVYEYTGSYGHGAKISGDIVIPESIDYYGNGNLLPVVGIGNGAFYKCSGLTSVTIPNSLTSIGEWSFGYCSGLTTLTIPNSVTSIGFCAFTGCDGLTTIIVESDNPFFDSRDECNAIIRTGENTLILGCMNTIIPNSVTSIGYAACAYIDGLASLNIPNSVTSIGEYAFWNCFGLTSVTIPSSVTSIGDRAFSSCPDLTSLTLTGKGTWNYNSYSMPGLNQIINQYQIIDTLNIGSGITSLGNFGFTPDVVNCYAETPPTCSSGTFSSYDGALHVPPTSTAAYFTTEYWQNFTNLNPDLTDKVTLNTTNANLFQWESLELTSTVSPEGGELIWSTTNPSIATVSDSGVVSFAGIGECDIYATLASNPAVYAICHITTSYPEITLSLSEESLAMNVGDEQTLTLTISPDNTGLSPSWSSSNTSVATVENGVVKAFGEGECDITATVLDKTATCHVTVINNVIITLNVENAILGANQILKVYPSCSPDVPVELVVTSSDPSVAVARVVNRTNAPAVGLMSFTEMGMALNYLEELAVPSESKTPALASTKAIMIVGVQNGTATITVTTADGKATPAILELRVVDVDGDRTITSTDITCLYNYLLNGDDSFITTSDTNGDGFITSTDITVLYNLMLGN